MMTVLRCVSCRESLRMDPGESFEAVHDWLVVHETRTQGPHCVIHRVVILDSDSAMLVETIDAFGQF